ncbi:hypothetical protein BD410DRAFT_695514, partial [Rickenella mellea]
SDGDGALRDVEAAEERRSRAKRGPKNDSLQHYHEPIPVKDKTGLQWEFRCRHCKRYLYVRRFRRTITGPDASFNKEPVLPRLGNLATHFKEKHQNIISGEDGSQAVASNPSSHGYTAASARLMAEYMLEGILNPQVIPTQRGFVRLITAWILEEDLPFTTAQMGGFARLLKYLSVHFILPTADLAFKYYIISVTMDNAAVNNVLAHTLATVLLHRYDIHFTPDNGQIRCLPHVVNLVVQKILSDFRKATDPDVDDWYIPNKHEPFHYDIEKD